MVAKGQDKFSINIVIKINFLIQVIHNLDNKFHILPIIIHSLLMFIVILLIKVKIKIIKIRIQLSLHL